MTLAVVVGNTATLPPCNPAPPAMTLAVVVGNTFTRVGLFHGHRLRLRRSYPTTRIRRRPGTLAHALPFSPTDSALASVVPDLTRPAARVLRRTTGRPPLIVGARTKTGLRFSYDRRRLGADRICTSVGAHQRYRGDTIVIDFGTCVTVNAVTAGACFIGGLILPGPELMLRALTENTGRLSRTRGAGRGARGAGRQSALAHDTADGLQSGAFHLLTGGVTHIIDRIRGETGRNWLVVATGGGAPRFRRAIPAVCRTDPDLALRGLAALLNLNRRSQ